MSRTSFTQKLVCAAALATLAARTGAYSGLSDDDIKLLKDPGGWEYLSLSDSENGVQTTHTCFDGTPHPEQCSGTLVLSPGNTFVQNMRIEGRTVERHGTYQLDGTQLAFFDELGTKDGPYTVELNSEAKSLVLKLAQVRMELELEKEYRSKAKKATEAGAQ